MIELLKGEKDLNTIASENNIQAKLSPQLEEGIDKASVVFDDTMRDNLRKLALERKEKS